MIPIITLFWKHNTSTVLEYGTALSYLEKTGPQQRFAVCAYLDELSSFKPRDELAGYFLFFGPVDRLGGFRAEESEAGAIVAGHTLGIPARATPCRC